MLRKHAFIYMNMEKMYVKYSQNVFNRNVKRKNGRLEKIHLFDVEHTFHKNAFL